ncbi:adapter protein MecA 1/2 [Lachnospiraceae bacterium C7]|nr:adapter protein MecA 1/2 [Lachnospiraceae bacterium C7]
MEFSRVGQHTIKCVITEDEIVGLGYTIDDIMSNGDKTQEFMNHIFDLAEQEFDMDFELGVKTVRADFLPNHIVSLTFSEKKGESVTEHLKDIVNGLLNAIPQERWDELKTPNDESEDKKIKESTLKDKTKIESKDDDEIAYVVAMISFDSFEVLEKFAKQVVFESEIQNSLYKMNGEYVLLMNLSDCEESEVLHISVLADEYAKKIDVGAEKKAYIEEHGKKIIAKKAVETLQEM